MCTEYKKPTQHKAHIVFFFYHKSFQRVQFIQKKCERRETTNVIVYRRLSTWMRGKEKKKTSTVDKKNDILAVHQTNSQRKWGWMEPALQTWKGKKSKIATVTTHRTNGMNDKTTKMTMSTTTTHARTFYISQSKSYQNCLEHSQCDFHQFFQSLNTFDTNKN